MKKIILVLALLLSATTFSQDYFTATYNMFAVADLEADTVEEESTVTGITFYSTNEQMVVDLGSSTLRFKMLMHTKRSTDENCDTYDSYSLDSGKKLYITVCRTEMYFIYGKTIYHFFNY